MHRLEQKEHKMHTMIAKHFSASLDNVIAKGHSIRPSACPSVTVVNHA